jgi:hypothetical protein
MDTTIKDRTTPKSQIEKQSYPQNFPNRIPSKFYTPDLQYASFLKCRGMEILGMKRDGTRYFFIFKDHPDRPKFTREFYGAGVIGIAEFRNAISELKSMLDANRGAI